MFTFLRKIRKSLLDGGQVRQYTIYAIGEVALVVIGILIALQINNWNNNRGEIAHFNLILHEIESNILLDSLELSADIYSLSNQISSLEKLLDENSNISHDSLNNLLELLLTYRWTDFNTTGIDQLRNSKNVKTVSPILIDWINRYYTLFEHLQRNSPFLFVAPAEDFKKYLIQNNLPPPPLNSNDLKKFKYELKNEGFQNHLKHLLYAKREQYIQFDYLLNFSRALLPVLRNKGEFRLELAMIGTATGEGWFTDIKLKLTDENVWENTLHLVDGELKFRIVNSWFQNWGGTEFPNGKGYLDGPNIPIKAGNYHVTFHSDTGVYNFRKMD